jgi:hypothetical protein
LQCALPNWIRLFLVLNLIVGLLNECVIASALFAKRCVYGLHPLIRMSALRHLLLGHNLVFQEVAQVMVFRRRIIAVFNQALDVVCFGCVPRCCELSHILLGHVLGQINVLSNVVASRSQLRCVEIQ